MSAFILRLMRITDLISTCFSMIQMRCGIRRGFRSSAQGLTLHLPARRLIAVGKEIILLFAAFCIFSCDPPSDDRLWLHNQTGDTLYFCLAYDTVLPSIPAANKSSDYILPNEEYNEQTGSGSWTPSILGRSPDNSLVVFYFLKKDMENNSWSEIVEKKLYRESKYHIDEIEALNWHLPIPKE